MSQVRILRIVVASASDVQAERDAIPHVVESLNRGIAKDRRLRFEVSRWETDAYPRFHPEGPQGGIDEILRIEDCDVLIGIFWKRFGTPSKDARSGTEHEFRRAYSAWKKNRRPQIMCYFNKKSSFPTSQTEAEQWGRVLEFQRNFPGEGLWCQYKSKSQFEKLLADHLTHFILDGFPNPPEEPSSLRDSTVAGTHATPVSAAESVETHIGATSLTPFRPPPSPWGLAITLCLITSLILLPSLLSPHRQAQRSGESRPEALTAHDVLDVPVVLAILEPYAALRDGGATSIRSKVLNVSTLHIRFLLKLPGGEDGGSYDVSLIDANDRVLLTIPKIKCVDGESISITLNRQFIKNGQYRLAVSQGKEAPIYYLFTIAEDAPILPR